LTYQEKFVKYGLQNVDGTFLIYLLEMWGSICIGAHSLKAIAASFEFFTEGKERFVLL